MEPDEIKRIFKTVKEINATIAAQERRRGEHSVSDIEDIGTQVAGIAATQEEQSTVVASVRQELHDLRAEQLQRVGSGATSEAMGAAIDQCDTISQKIADTTAELESLQEALGAIGES